METNEFEKQLNFLIEIDKAKNVFRQTKLINSERRENVAEHSWHFALMALLLVQYSEEDIDVLKVLKMALIQ